MKHKDKIKFSWSHENTVCICRLYDHDNVYTGVATCHPSDLDMKSQKVGEEIAYTRAIISALKTKKKEIKFELRGLLGYYYAIQHTSKFNRKSYEARMLYRQIRMREDDVKSIDEEIDAREVYINHYIDEKDKFYQIIRQNRAKTVPIENE